MALTAQFATYYGLPKQIYKTPVWEGSYDVKAYNEINDLTCSFVLGGSGFHSYNMMKVTFPGGLTKNYFIEKREGMPGNMTKITATCDVLSTYSSAILTAPAILNRTSNTNFVNFLLKDNQKTTISKTILSSKQSEKITDNEEYFYVGIIQNKSSLREVVTNGSNTNE